MSVPEQFDAIMALPIGGAIIACALGFFGLLAGIAKFIIERRAEQFAADRERAP
jgi:hypothetical protein